MRAVLKCPRCGNEYPPYPILLKCPRCGSPLIPVVKGINAGNLLDLTIRSFSEGVWVFKEFLVSKGSHLVSLGEGLTPLIRARNLGMRLGINNVLIKNESENPLGTFIDRGSATLISAALNGGLRRVAVASLGDLGISVSAYARRAGVRVYVAMPHTVIPSKAYQTLLLADKVEFTNTYEEAKDKVLGIRNSLPVTPLNPYLIDGYKTIYYEIFRDLQKHPDILIIPIGDGALLTAVWHSLKELKGNTVIVGVRGCSPTLLLRDISVEKPLYEPLIDEIIRESGGLIIDVCDDDALRATQLLATSEGILTEPVGSASIAALIKLSSKGWISKRDTIVALITGGSLRDTSILRLLSSKQLAFEDELRIGFTKSKILEALLSHGPLHTYAIWKILRHTYGIKISLRVLYQHMEDLERLGLIKVQNYERVSGRIRKVYTITTKGIMLMK